MWIRLFILWYLGACLNGFAAAGGFAEVCLQVALDGTLVADAEVEAQVQVVGELLFRAAAAGLTCVGIIAILRIVLAF